MVWQHLVSIHGYTDQADKLAPPGGGFLGLRG